MKEKEMYLDYMRHEDPDNIEVYDIDYVEPYEQYDEFHKALVEMYEQHHMSGRTIVMSENPGEKAFIEYHTKYEDGWNDFERAFKDLASKFKVEIK